VEKLEFEGVVRPPTRGAGDVAARALILADFFRADSDLISRMEPTQLSSQP
jgi:hypothetical protein